MLISEAFEAFEVDELMSERRTQDTMDSYRCTRNSLLRSIGDDISTALLTYRHIILWKRDMCDWENLPSYIAQNLRNLRRVLTYLSTHGFVSVSPDEIKVPPARYRKTGWLSVDEVRQFLQAIDEGARKSIRAKQSYLRDKALFAMQFSSGARISELLQLNCGAVDQIFSDNSARIRGKGRVEADDDLYFDTNAVAALSEYLNSREDTLEPLFLSRESKRLHITSAIQSFHRYIKLAGIEKKGAGATHILRHSFGTDLDLKGMDIYGVSKQLRHSRVETTKIYIHSEDKNRRLDYDKFHSTTPLQPVSSASAPWHSLKP